MDAYDNDTLVVTASLAPAGAELRADPDAVQARLLAAGMERIALRGALFDDVHGPVFVWVEDDASSIIDACERLQDAHGSANEYRHDVFLNDGQLTVSAAYSAPVDALVTLEHLPGMDPTRAVHQTFRIPETQYVGWWQGIAATLVDWAAGASGFDA